MAISLCYFSSRLNVGKGERKGERFTILPTVKKKYSSVNLCKE